jgi:hypothetical protein
MLNCSKDGKSRKIQQRAAQIRQQWSPRERARRTGLPPDMPARLRDQLDELPVINWPPAGKFELVESRLVPIQIFRHEN